MLVGAFVVLSEIFIKICFKKFSFQRKWENTGNMINMKDALNANYWDTAAVVMLFQLVILEIFLAKILSVGD